MKDTVHILGVPISKRTMAQTVRLLEEQIDKPCSRPFHLITANPEIVMKHQKDEQLQNIVREADLVTADGVGILLASRWKGTAIAERVTGYDLLIQLLHTGNRKGWSFYFLGSDEETNKTAVENIKKKFPNVQIAGRHHGFFNKDEEENLLNDIETAQPDVLAVALGAPFAEKWIYAHKPRLKTKVAFGVGGSLDVVAGKARRAPLIWQRLQLEWLYRLLSQPSRWRRQRILPVFAYKAFMDRNR